MSLKFKVFANCLDGDYADKTNVRLRRFYTKMSDEKIDAFIDKSLNKFGTRLMRLIEECEGEKIPGAKKRNRVASTVLESMWMFSGDEKRAEEIIQPFAQDLIGNIIRSVGGEKFLATEEGKKTLERLKEFRGKNLLAVSKQERGAELN